MQTAIPCLFMRGGTSRGPFFNAADLPADIPTRDKVLLAVMGSPDKRQIDGLGGAHPLTSKVGIVVEGPRPGVDLDFLFAQLQPDKDTVDTTPNCGNMLAAVVPFALETGLVQAAGRHHHAARADAQHRHAVRHHGADARTAVSSTRAAPGSTACPAPRRRSRSTFSIPRARSAPGLLPTGHVRDVIDGIDRAPASTTACRW